MRRLLSLLLLLAACAPPARSTPSAPPSPTGASPAQRPTVTPFLPLGATVTPAALTVWVSPALPEALRTPLLALAEADGRPLAFVESRQAAEVRVEPAPEQPLTTWIYALVGPFPTLEDSLSLEDLVGLWRGETGPALYADPATAAALETLFGPSTWPQQVAAADLLQQAWTDRPALALLPFEALEPRWKVLAVEGQSPVRKAFDPAAYPLRVTFGLSGDAQAVAALRAALNWPATNRDPGRMTVLVMTGVSGLTRATAWMLDFQGMERAAEYVGPILRQADLAHVSHEVAFAENCPPPDPSPAVTRFCSQPSQIALFESIGVDVVELTGNHVMDWGAPALRYTLGLYRDRGWATFGGGDDLETALQPALIEHNGNRLAFLGCNPAGPAYAWATEAGPGAAPCDYERLFTEVARLREAGYLPIFTFQWAESYRYAPLPAQVEGFRAAVEAGAVIVSGSQAHQPQGMEFYQGGFIHYGLGNLFFDQMWSPEVRQEFLDRHVFYDGRHISTELLTAMLEDWFRPRPMTAEERAALLQAVFTASGW